MNIDDLLQRRNDIKLVWVEPWPALNLDLQEAHANVEIAVTVDGCINMQRLSYYQRSGSEKKLSDRELLEDFIAIHWAYPEKKD